MKKVKCRPVVRKDKPLHLDTSTHWKMSAPFVVNKRGVLVHRVRSASSHEEFRTHMPHHSCLCWCGSAFNSGGLEFVDDPPTE